MLDGAERSEEDGKQGHHDQTTVSDRHSLRRGWDLSRRPVSRRRSILHCLNRFFHLKHQEKGPFQYATTDFLNSFDLD